MIDWQGSDVAMLLCVHQEYQIIQSVQIMIIRLICLFRESRNINSMRNPLSFVSQGPWPLLYFPNLQISRNSVKVRRKLSRKIILII